MAHKIDVALQNGAYQALEKALKQMTPETIIDEVKKSSLRGRGGAGFPTGMKWSFVPKDSPKAKYVICNADESEPGTCKDRPLMEMDPHQLIEGLIIAGRAINAHTGFPWTPYYGVQVQGAPNACSLVYANSNFCTVRPGAYLGGAGKDFSNSGFEPTTTNFPASSLSYFAPPTFTNVDVPPPTPGVARNSFRGPRYSSSRALRRWPRWTDASAWPLTT